MTTILAILFAATLASGPTSAEGQPGSPQCIEKVEAPDVPGGESEVGPMACDLCEEDAARDNPLHECDQNHHCEDIPVRRRRVPVQ